MTIVLTGDKRVIDQIVKQLNKLIPVLKVKWTQKCYRERYSLMKFSIDNNLADIDVIADISWKSKCYSWFNYSFCRFKW